MSYSWQSDIGLREVEAPAAKCPPRGHGPHRRGPQEGHAYPRKRNCPRTPCTPRNSSTTAGPISRLRPVRGVWVSATSNAVRCIATTKAGTHCWHPHAGLPGHPDRYWQHLTPEENAAARSQPATATPHWMVGLPVEPACWRWPLPPQLPDGRYGISLYEWHDGRCAICDVGGGTVCDHDHETALIRGYLCHSWNVREGMDWRCTGTFANYRKRHPAAILGVELPYVSLVTGPAEPLPQPLTEAELWKDHPFRGVL